MGRLGTAKVQNGTGGCWVQSGKVMLTQNRNHEGDGEMDSGVIMVPAEGCRDPLASVECATDAGQKVISCTR